MSINFCLVWPNTCPMTVYNSPFYNIERGLVKGVCISLVVILQIMCFWSRFPNHSCRLFKELADDSDILKAVAFDQVKISGIHESFWQPAGMLCRCLPTGNPTAFNAIRKVQNSCFGRISKFYQHCAMPLVASGYFSFTWLHFCLDYC